MAKGDYNSSPKGADKIWRQSRHLTGNVLGDRVPPISSLRSFFPCTASPSFVMSSEVETSLIFWSST
ncbi:MAG: hypothetical protein DMF24_06235 [Verrucomicrobia bacterium]|nr:MAG: hypothetical protein DMF24_06235 [Verrucomicrobiota bacterium]